MRNIRPENSNVIFEEDSIVTETSTQTSFLPFPELLFTAESMAI